VAGLEAERRPAGQLVLRPVAAEVRASLECITVLANLGGYTRRIGVHTRRRILPLARADAVPPTKFAGLAFAVMTTTTAIAAATAVGRSL
jgi:hypothetical protein